MARLMPNQPAPGTRGHYQTRRISAGRYMVTKDHDSQRVVMVVENEQCSRRGGRWVAFAEWDRFLYADPCHTKAEAVEAAWELLNA